MSESTISTADICARVRARWAQMLPIPMINRADHNISLCVFGGCERLARVVKDSADRNLLIREIANQAPVAGVLDLTDVAFANYLTDTYRREGAIRTTTPSAVTFHHVSDINRLQATDPEDETCVWYLLRGQELVFKNPADGTLNTYVTPVSLTGSYIPEIGNNDLPLPFELEDALIDQVDGLVKQLGGMKFLQMDGEEAQRVVNG